MTEPLEVIEQKECIVGFRHAQKLAFAFEWLDFIPGELFFRRFIRLLMNIADLHALELIIED